MRALPVKTTKNFIGLVAYTISIMKKILLALLVVVLLLNLGFYGMEMKSTSGPFFMFIGVCTAIGLTLDIIIMIREKIRRSKISKLG